MTVKFKFNRSLKKSDIVFSGVIFFAVHEDYIEVSYLKYDDECFCEIVHFHRFDAKDISYISVKDNLLRYSIKVK